MTLIIRIKNLGADIVNLDKYDFYLNEFRKNLTANLDRSPLIHSYGYASASDQPTLFAIFSLIFAPFKQYAGKQ